jgi:hypothetical protein
MVAVNLAIAATFITALVAWDLLRHLPLPLGVAAHGCSTVIVGVNGLRLLRARARAWNESSSNKSPEAVPILRFPATEPTSALP